MKDFRHEGIEGIRLNERGTDILNITDLQYVTPITKPRPLNLGFQICPVLRITELVAGQQIVYMYILALIVICSLYDSGCFEDKHKL